MLSIESTNTVTVAGVSSLCCCWEAGEAGNHHHHRPIAAVVVLHHHAFCGSRHNLALALSLPLRRGSRTSATRASISPRFHWLANANARACAHDTSRACALAQERILLSIESLLSNGMAFIVHCVLILGRSDLAEYQISIKQWASVRRSGKYLRGWTNKMPRHHRRCRRHCCKLVVFCSVPRY